MTLIVTEGLSKTFRRIDTSATGRGRLSRILRPDYVEHDAVRGLDLSIERGEAVAYVGPNGAGKSTTIKMLTGILTPTAGTVRVGGLDPSRDRIANARQIGVVFGQRTQLWWDLPVNESFRLLRDMYGLSHAEYARTLAQFDEVLGIEELLPLVARKLSLGQRMRCDLAAALLHRPPIVFLDEPTIGLDVDVRDRVRDFVRQLVSEGTTVILTTHDMSDVSSICDRIIIIDHGTKLFDGPLQTVTDTYATEGVVHFTLRSGAPRLDALRAACPGAEFDTHGVETTATFNRSKTTASDVLRAVFELQDVADVRVDEAGIESVVRKMYARTLAVPAPEDV